MKNEVKQVAGNIGSKQKSDQNSNADTIEKDEARLASLPGSAAIRNENGRSKNFNLVVDQVPYLVKVTPFSFNDETRFTVSVNGGEEHIFTWDSAMLRLRAIDDPGTLPDTLETAINQQLLNMLRRS